MAEAASAVRPRRYERISALSPPHICDRVKPLRKRCSRLARRRRVTESGAMAAGSQQRGAVVVTGASSGIGEACARRLAGLGFHVFAGVRKHEDGERLAREIAGVDAAARSTSPTRDSIAARRAERRASGRRRGLAGLVNNAGVAVPAPIEHQPIDDFRAPDRGQPDRPGRRHAGVPAAAARRAAAASSTSARSAARSPSRCSAPTPPRSSRSRASPTRCGASCARGGSRSP